MFAAQMQIPCGLTQAGGYNRATMFPYDAALLSAVQTAPESIADVIHIMRTIDNNCVDGDGLKWFNWLYLQVTEAVEARVQSGGFSDPAWLAALDVQFAKLYFGALRNSLSGRAAPACWQALFQRRDEISLLRIQCALAGINAHINHDLPQAIVNTGELTGQHYADYSALNSTLDELIELAKKTLLVRLLGDPAPVISHLEDLIAAWSVAVARETAWQNAQILAHLNGSSLLSANFMNTLDVLTTAGNAALLVNVA
jgi:hypothetical protein